MVYKETHLLVYESVYWLNINNNIENAITIAQPVFNFRLYNKKIDMTYLMTY